MSQDLQASLMEGLLCKDEQIHAGDSNHGPGPFYGRTPTDSSSYIIQLRQPLLLGDGSGDGSVFPSIMNCKQGKG